MASDNDFINVFEAAALLGVHDQTLRKLARQKKLPAFKVGKEWRFSQKALIQWADDQSHDTQESDENNGSCSVVIIDDEENVCKALAGALKRIGCDTRQATSGAMGLRLIAEQAPDLILLDLKMPDMNGPMFLAELRKNHPDLPVTIVTGYPDSDLMHEAMQQGPVMALSKPVDREHLESTVQLVLGKKVRIR